MPENIAEAEKTEIGRQPAGPPAAQIKDLQTRTKKTGGFLFFQKKVSLKDKIIFTDQLEVMIKAGLPIGEALKSLADETDNKYFSQILAEVITDVEGGQALSAALARHDKIFNEIYVSLIKSGEQAGKIEDVLLRLSTQLQKDYELNRKVRSALAYPVFVVIALIVVMSLVLVFIMPQLKAIFDDAGVKLPLMTRIVLKLSDILKIYGLYALVLVVILISIALRWRKTRRGRRFFDRTILFIPVIGVMLKKTYMARFSRTLSSLLASGLPILDAFKVVSEVVGNVLYEEEINNLATEIKAGTSISKIFKSSKIFPGIVGSLAAVGEKSGSLSDVFETLANFFDRDVEAITSNLSSMLEPLIMVVIGIGIGTLIISVLQPIYGLVNAI